MANRSFTDVVSFVRGSGATYHAANGRLVKSDATGVGTPRIEYNPATGELSGALIETQKTNWIFYSENVANTQYWVTSNVSLTADAETAPNGTVSAFKITESTNNSLKELSYTASITKSSGVYYTYSFFAKPVGNTSQIYAYLGPHFTHDGNVGGVFVLKSNGSATATGNGTSNVWIRKVSDGFYRCAVSGLGSPNTTSFSANVQIYNSANTTTTYTGDGVSGIYFWGVQVEQGDIPSSYIPTSGGTVSRAADLLSVNTQRGWFANSTSGNNTYRLTFQFPWANPDSYTTRGLLFIDDSSLKRVFSIGQATNYMVALDGPSSSISNTTVNVTTGQVFTSVLSVNSTRKAISTNGGGLNAGSSVNTNFLVSNTGTMNFSGSTTLPYVVWLRKFEYYPRMFTNAEMVLLSANAS